MDTILITGANGNLGTAVTKLLLEKNFRVIALGSPGGNMDSLGKHDALETAMVDLTNETETGQFIKELLTRHTTICGALFLAGGFASGTIEHTNGELLHKQIALNFETVYYAVRPLFTHMLAKKNGRLVFIGSRPALVAAQGKNVLAYALSKSMLFKLAEFLNEGGKNKNVTATVVAPSTIDTIANRKSMPDANFEDWVKPETLAEILAFLLSSAGSPLRETVLKVYGNA